jgi:hypothetical protein
LQQILVIAAIQGNINDVLSVDRSRDRGAGGIQQRSGLLDGHRLRDLTGRQLRVDAVVLADLQFDVQALKGFEARG